jgi:hypothetical protein
MFEGSDPDELVCVIENSHRTESMAMARKLAAMAWLLVHRIAEAEEADPDPGYAMVTGFARTTAEVSAAMNLSPMGASHLVACAESLDSRLPKVAALLADGRTDWRTVQLIVTRTELVKFDLIGKLDESLADRIERWHCWSRRRIINAVDAAVQAIDPDAARERRVHADTERHITIANRADGMAELRGTLPVTAAAAVDARLSELAAGVCAKDPRTPVQRRADAMTALTESRALACQCGHPDCPVRAEDEVAPAGGVRTVINVIASQDTVTGDSEQPGYLAGYGVIDADQVRALAETAAMRIIDGPQITPEQALRYQPTVALERWIRCRDLTCRFPGCDRPASFCDLDHTIPFNHLDPQSGGLTVPWNLACLCRLHHRLKTFHAGWRDEQLPDGTIIWTSPTGRVYRTVPGGPELFPQMRAPACTEPAPRRRNHSRERAARIARARKKIREQRPVNAAQRRVNRARRQEISDRKWRNNMRDLLLLFKGKPSTSPWCTWVNDPYEPEELPPDWEPPPQPPPTPDDEPPF